MQESGSHCLTIHQRLDLLESRGQKLKWIIGGLLAATLLLMGEVLHQAGGRSKKIEAEQFIVKDKAGKVRARLGADSSGLPELVLLDSKGIVQAALHVYCDDAAALALNEHGGTRIHLEATGDGNSSIRMFDRSGQSNSLLFMSPEGASGLLLSNQGSSALLGMKPGIDPGIVMTDAGGREQGRLGSSEVDVVSLGLRRGVPAESLPTENAAGVSNPMAVTSPSEKKPASLPMPDAAPGSILPKSTAVQPRPRVFAGS